jgi:hypothetical protein
MGSGEHLRLSGEKFFKRKSKGREKDQNESHNKFLYTKRRCGPKVVQMQKDSHSLRVSME